MHSNFPENYQVEDFVSDQSFFNYHLRSNKDDVTFWTDWLNNNRHKADLVNEAKAMIDTLSMTISNEVYNKEFDKLNRAISTSGKIFTLNKPPKSFISRRQKKLVTICAFFVLIVSGVLFIFLKKSDNKPSQLAATHNNGLTPLALTLSDSSVITLEPGSYLEYPGQFNGADRNVYLHGDAQFQVKRNTVRPFKVHTGNMIATVLGTVFNINTSHDSSIVVKLFKGKLIVEIVNSGKSAVESVLLIPDEKAIYVRKTGELYKDKLVPENRFSFHKSNFQEVAAQIKNEFGITVLNKSNNNNWLFTGEFTNASAKEIIENICLIKNLSCKTSEDTIVIR